MRRIAVFLLLIFASGSAALARDIGYEGQEVTVYIEPNEPTQINFPAEIAGGFMKTDSALQLQRQGQDLILFARGSLVPEGEAIIVRLQDGRSFSVRIKLSDGVNPRDHTVKIEDLSESALEEEEEEAPYLQKNYNKAPPTLISGFMRELILFAEFSKPAIKGYRVSEQHKGQTVFHDGTMHATIDKIFIGPRLWGYVLDAENLLDTTQRLNPGTFRLDGTRAISSSNWDLAPKPLTVEQEIAGKHKSKIYIITRAK